jgi:hypothetical protein
MRSAGEHRGAAAECRCAVLVQMSSAVEAKHNNVSFFFHKGCGQEQADTW